MNIYNWQKEAYKLWIQNDMKGIIKAVPGAGKTQAGIEIIKCVLMENPNAKIIVLCPNNQIIQQWKKYVNEQIKDFNNIFIITYFEAIKHETADFMIFDECHSILSPVRSKVLDIKCVCYLGLSATPMNSDEKIGSVFVDISWGNANVAPFEIIYQKFDMNAEQHSEYYSLTNSVKNAFRSYNKDEISHDKLMAIIMKRRSFVYNLPQRLSYTIDLINQNINERIIVFSERLEQINELYDYLNNTLNIPTSIYTSEKDTISDYINKKTNILLSSKMIKEGFDDPSTTVGIVLSTPLTERNHIQTIGRIVRNYPDKKARIIVLLARGTTDETLGEKKIRYGKKYTVDTKGNIFIKKSGKRIYSKNNPDELIKILRQKGSGRFYINNEGEVRMYKNNEWIVLGTYKGEDLVF